jgi:hypothetical protein
VTERTDADRELLDEAAAAIVRRGLGVPAMMFLEMASPMNVVTSSMLHMLTPVWNAALPGKRLDRMAELLEDRGTIPELIAAIDTAEDKRRADDRAARAARPGRRWPWRRRPDVELGPEHATTAVADSEPTEFISNSPVGAIPGSDPERPEDRHT